MQEHKYHGRPAKRGHIPFGYRIEKGRAVVNEKEAGQLRQIFTGYLSGQKAPRLRDLFKPFSSSSVLSAFSPNVNEVESNIVRLTPVGHPTNPCTAIP